MSFTIPAAVSTWTARTRLDPALRDRRAGDSRTAPGSIARRGGAESSSTSRPRTRGHLGPGAAEHPALEGEHPFAPAQAVHERRFPRAVSVRGVEEGLALRPDNLLEILYAAHCHIDDFTGIEVHRGTVHRGQHLVGHGGRTRDGEKFTAASDSHGMRFPGCHDGGAFGPGSPADASKLGMAERGGFEPPDRRRSTVFKTAAFNRSATSPRVRSIVEAPGETKAGARD